MDGRSSTLEDPFSDFSLFSLYSRTFNQHGLDPDPDAGTDSLYKDTPEAVRSLFDSMALKNPNRLMEQAKSALESLKVHNLENTRGEDGVSDLRGVVHGNLQGEVENMEIARDEGTVSDLPRVNHENQRVRRPGLVGRKKARFSLKPNSSQSLESLLPELDIEKFRDPEELFLAFERHENAKNELRRQSGIPLTDLDQNVHHRAERRRRPGLSRKRPVYKHHYPVAQSGDDNIFLSSQETLSQDLYSPNPSNQLPTEYTDKIPVLSTRELSGPMVAGRDKPDDISEDLETGQDNDDESDDIIGMLKERFKPIKINKSCLPDLDSALQSEFKTLGESLQDSQDKMSDLHGIVSAIGKETTLGCNKERSSGHPSTSATPPKSPYSSMSLLKARLHQSRQGIDRFSALAIDLSPPGKAASCKDTNDLAARDLENPVKDSMKWPKISMANTMHIGSGRATGGNDTRETNENESESHVASKDTQDLAAAKFTSSEKSISDGKMMPAVLSDSIEHMELDHDTVEHSERDMNPKSPLHEKESVTTHTMETLKDGSKTLGVFSDDAMHIEIDHGIGRDQSSIPAAHEKESTVLHSKDIHDMNAEILSPSEETMKDSSTISGTALDTTPHVELDHDFMVKDRRVGVMEENPSEAFDDDVIAADQHIEPDGWMAEEDVQGCNMEKSSHNKEQSTACADEDLDMDRRSSGHDKLPTDFPASGHDQDLEGATGDLVHDRPASSQAQPLKGTAKASSNTKRRKSREPPAERRIAKAASKYAREFKENSRRKSLAACGTRWEKGIRQSTRIRTRPLEYWRGERQLYGRIHDNLITVVGAKYFSPTKEGGPATLKVKSYVSEEYMDIVEQAALH